MSDEKATSSKTQSQKPRSATELDPKAVAILKSQFGDDVVDVLLVEKDVVDLAFVIENAKAEVTRRQEAMSFNQVALQRRVYENEIVRYDAEIFKELALLVRSIGDRYRALTGLPPINRK